MARYLTRKARTRRPDCPSSAQYYDAAVLTTLALALAEPGGLLLEQEEISALPWSQGRYQELPLLAPGAVGGIHPNVMGGRYDQNQYMLDGVNVSDPATQTFSFNMPLVAVERGGLLTHGLPPSYGRALGGVVVLESRSGDSETWEGEVTLRYTDERFSVYPTKPPFTDTFSDQQVVLYTGGPLRPGVTLALSSRLLSRRNSVNWDPDEAGRPEGPDPVYPSHDLDVLYPLERWGTLSVARLDAQRGAHSLFAVGLFEYTHIENMRQDPLVLPSAENEQTQTSGTLILGHDLQAGRWRTESRVSAQRGHIDWGPVSVEDPDCQAGLGQVQAQGDYPGFEHGPQGVGFGCLDRGRLGVTSTTLRHAPRLHLELGGRVEYLFNEALEPGLDRVDLGELYQQYPERSEQFAENSMLLGAAWMGLTAWPWSWVELAPSLRVDVASLDPWYRRAELSPRMRVALGPHWFQLYGSAASIPAVPQLDMASFASGAWDHTVCAGEGPDCDPHHGSAAITPHDLEAPRLSTTSAGLWLGTERGGLDLGVVRRRASAWEDVETNLIWDDSGETVVATHNGEPTALYELRSLPGALSYQAAYASFRLRLEPPSLCRDLDQGLDGACPGRALATLGANLTRSSAVGVASDPRVSGTFHSFAADTPEEQAPLPWDHTWVANA